MNTEAIRLTDFERHQASDAFRKLEEILSTENIRTVFQPIVSLTDGSVFGYEALSRGPLELESPNDLFALAKKHNLLWELEYLCRRKALENSEQLKLCGCIFLNVSPDIISDPKLKAGMTIEALAKYGINPANIIIEITEKSALLDYRDYKRTIDHYKKQGYFIAIDDAGSGYSGLKLISDVRPHFVKLDMDLIRDVDKDKFKLHLIKSFKDFCGATNIRLIAEGIETQEELETLIGIGVNYGQGFFIQRPSERPSPISDQVTGIIKRLQDWKQALFHQRPSKLPVRYIMRPLSPVSPSTLCSTVAELFTQYPFIAAIPIVQAGKVEGIVTRDKFYAKLGSRYGYSIFYNRDVQRIMGKDPLTVDHQTPLGVVSKLAMSRSAEDVYDSILVTQNGKYYGIVTVKDLLEKYTEMEISYARNQNPLTGLPGNASIQGKLNDCLRDERAFSVIYVDIDNFKPYNDVYGFAAGDKIIQLLANILMDCMMQEYGEAAFVGHIGGDDFVVVIEGSVEQHQLEKTWNNIIALYGEKVANYYTMADLQNGGIRTRNRQGKEEFFIISTLSIACLVVSEGGGYNTMILAERATQIKKKCKAVSGNSCSIEFM